MKFYITGKYATHIIVRCEQNQISGPRPSYWLPRPTMTTIDCKENCNRPIYLYSPYIVANINNTQTIGADFWK